MKNKGYLREKYVIFGCLFLWLGVFMALFAMNTQIVVAADNQTVSFTDVKDSDWFYSYLFELAHKDLIKGNTDGSYAPDKPLYVDEFLAMALRTMGQEQKNANGYWAQNYIDRAIELGLIENGEFSRYDAPISREKIAKIVVKSLDPETVDADQELDAVFSDFQEVSEKEFVRKAIGLGVLAGYKDGTFRPSANATRAEAATMVVRMIDPTYRLERYGNIFFNAKVDLNETGNMKLEKAEEFVMATLKELRFVPDSAGKITIRGKTPKMPEGQYFSLAIRMADKTGTTLAVKMTNTVVEDYFIPQNIDFEYKTNATKAKTRIITVEMLIPTGTAPFDLDGETGDFLVRKDYLDESRCYFSLIYPNLDSVEYDTEITKQLWGW